MGTTAQAGRIHPDVAWAEGLRKLRRDEHSKLGGERTQRQDSVGGLGEGSVPL